MQNALLLDTIFIEVINYSLLMSFCLVSLQLSTDIDLKETLWIAIWTQYRNLLRPQ